MGNLEKQYLSDTNVFDRSLYESYEPDTKFDGSNNAVLRVIRGPLAEWDKLNRNGRLYSEKLWDKVLETPYVKEQLMYNTLFGEANHPVDRMEVDFERVSHRIAKMWKVPQSNQIYGEIHILDTPFGRIINTLYEAGGVIGYSSRAGGALHQRKDYIEVDENQYNFVTFDAVPFPSVQSARPSDFVTEGADIQKHALTKEVHNALFKIIKECDEKDFNNIKSFINSIEGYDLTPEKLLLESVENITFNNSDESEDIVRDTIEDNNEEESVVDTLQSTLQSVKAQKQSLEKENRGLKDSLNNALNKISNVLQDAKDKEIATQDEISNLKDTIARKEVKINELQEEIDMLQDELDSLQTVEEACKALKYQNSTLIKEGVEANNSDLKSKLSDKEDENKSLREDNKNLSKEREELQSELQEAYGEIANAVKDINSKDAIIKAQQDTINSLKSDVKSTQDELDKVDEDYQSAIDRRDNQIEQYEEKIKELEDKIRVLSSEVEDIDESYSKSKSYTKSLKNDLISVIAGNYGLTNESVKAKLPVGFGKSEIYTVCESMSRNSSKNLISNSIVDTQIVNESTKNRVTNSHSNSRGSRLSEIISTNRRG